MLSNMEVKSVPQTFLTKIILANNMDTGKDWEPYLFGEFEWETWMRDLDSRGFVTGHVYQDYPKKASNKSSH